MRHALALAIALAALGCGSETDAPAPPPLEAPAPTEARLTIGEDGALTLDGADITLDELRATANLGPLVLAPARAAPPARVIEVAEALQARDADYRIELADAP